MFFIQVGAYLRQRRGRGTRHESNGAIVVSGSFLSDEKMEKTLSVAFFIQVDAYLMQQKERMGEAWLISVSTSKHTSRRRGRKTLSSARLKIQ